VTEIESKLKMERDLKNEIINSASSKRQSNSPELSSRGKGKLGEV